MKKLNPTIMKTFLKENFGESLFYFAFSFLTFYTLLFQYGLIKIFLENGLESVKVLVLFPFVTTSAVFIFFISMMIKSARKESSARKSS